MTAQELEKLCREVWTTTPRVHFNGLFYYPIKPVADCEGLTRFARIFYAHGSASNPEWKTGVAAPGDIGVVSGYVIGVAAASDWMHWRDSHLLAKERAS